MYTGQAPAILPPGYLQHASSQSLTSGPTCGFNTGVFPLYDAELSELNNLCDDNTVLSASNINPQCLQQLLDAYFLHHHNQPYSFFHEDHFRQDVSLGLVPDHLTSAICAVAIRFATDNGPQTRAALAFSRSSWASVSKLDMDAEGQFDLEVVQSLTLLAVYEYTGERHRCQALQFHLDTDSVQMQGSVALGSRSDWLRAWHKP